MISPARQARIDAGYGGKAIAELEKATGIKAHNIRRIERGYVPPECHARTLAEALGCDMKVFGLVVKGDRPANRMSRGKRLLP